MNVSTRIREGVLIVDLEGRWPRNEEGWTKIQTTVMDVLAPWSGKFALNIHHDEFIGDRMLGMLVRIHQATHRGTNKRSTVIASSAKIRAIFDVTRLTSIFNIVATEEEALGLPPVAAPIRKTSASAILLIVAGILVLIGVIRACSS